MMEIQPISDLRNNNDEICIKLAEAESESVNPTAPKKTHQEVMNRLQGRINKCRK